MGEANWGVSLSPVPQPNFLEYGKESVWIFDFPKQTVA